MGAEIIALIAGARKLISFLVTQAMLAGEDQITPEQLAQIKAEADFSDSKWDEAVSAAKARAAEAG